jgi:GNAT superfamily N-acetyltransferase
MMISRIRPPRPMPMYISSSFVRQTYSFRIPRPGAFEPRRVTALCAYDPGMTEASVRVGTIREDHYEQVLPLIAGYQRFYEAEPDEARNRAFFRRFVDPSEDGVLLGAWVGDELAGFATLYWTFSSTHAAEVALMNDLFVDERQRGAGVGLALIRASVEEARRHGMRHLEWLTHVDNLRAQRLYDRTEAERSAWFGYEIRIR